MMLSAERPVNTLNRSLNALECGKRQPVDELVVLYVWFSLEFEQPRRLLNGEIYRFREIAADFLGF